MDRGLEILENAYVLVVQIHVDVAVEAAFPVEQPLSEHRIGRGQLSEDLLHRLPVQLDKILIVHLDPELAGYMNLHCGRHRSRSFLLGQLNRY